MRRTGTGQAQKASQVLTSFSTDLDGDFAAGLRRAVASLSQQQLAEALEAEIEHIEEYMEELAEDSSQEAVMEGYDLYLCSLQLLEHYVHSDEGLTEARLAKIYAEADRARASLKPLSP